MDIDEFNIKIDTDLYGTIELLPGSSLNDMTWLHQPEIKALSAREFVVQLLQKHLVAPTLSQTDVRAWPDHFLEMVATRWFHEQQDDANGQMSGPFSWESFQTAIYVEDAAQRKRFQGTAEHLAGSVVQQQISSMLEPILRAQSQMAGTFSAARRVSESLRTFPLNLGPLYSGMHQQVATIGHLNQLWRSLATPSWTSSLGLSVLPGIQGALQTHAQLVASLTAERAMFEGLFGQITETLRRQWDWMPAALRRFKREYQERVLKAFLELDLWPAPSMEPSFLEQLVPLALQGNRRAATLFVWNYYMRPPASRLEKMVASWADDPEYAARKQIFEQALIIHQQKLYAGSIPMLLAQLEGIASEFVMNKGLLAPKGLKLGKTGAIVQGALNVAGQADTMDEDDVEVMVFVAVSAVIQYVQEVAFENLDFQARYKELRARRDLNRHGILHGIQINYQSAMNSLRCFLLLDTLYGFRNQAKGAEGAA